VRDKELLFSEEETHSIREGYALRVVLTLVILSFIVLGLSSRILKSEDSQTLAISQSLLVDQKSGVSWVGLELIDVTPQIARDAQLDANKGQGAFVQKVISNAPAEKAGIQPGDIIVSLNGRRIRCDCEFKNDLSGIEVGEEIEMCIARDDYRTTVYAITEEAPLSIRNPQSAIRNQKASPYLGVKVSDLSPESSEMSRLEELGKEGGVLVQEAALGSPAEKVGIQTGDVIMSFDYRKVRTVREFLTDLSGAEAGDRIRICIMREDIRKTLYPVLEKNPDDVNIGAQLFEPAAIKSTREILPKSVDNQDWGLILSPLTKLLRQKYSIPYGINGVVIFTLKPGGLTERAGLLPGDLIVSMNKQKIDSMQTFFRAYSDIEKGLLIEIYRNKSLKYFNIESTKINMPIML